MRALVALANRIKQLKTSELLKILSENKQFTDLIIELNTRKQLFEMGVNSDGISLENIGGGYSGKTIEYKKEKGQRYDHVTLNDTGDFYNSFKVFLDSSGFVISADVVKDTTNLITEWGEKILGLTHESLSILREKAKEILIPYVRKKILTR